MGNLFVFNFRHFKQHMLVDLKNICFNTTLNIVRGKESLQQSTVAWGEGFHGSPLAVICLYPPKLSLWLISQERNICPFPFFYPQCVGGCASPGGGRWESSCAEFSLLPESQTKCNCSQLAGSYLLRVMSGRRQDQGIMFPESINSLLAQINPLVGSVALGSTSNIHRALQGDVSYLGNAQQIMIP